jgi:hypothetical protein
VRTIFKNKTFWGVLFILGCALFAVAVSIWAADPDVFWHLAVGNWIAIHHAVPRTDIYSWTAYGQHWTDHEWGWELLIYWVYRYTSVIGLWGLVLILGVSGGLFIQRALASKGIDSGVSYLAGGLAPFLLLYWLKPWPQAGVYFLFCTYLYLSIRNKWTQREALVAFAVGLVWANIHSTAVLFPLLLSAETGWAWFIRKERNVGWRLGVVGVAVLATLINPHGVGLWIYAVKQGLMSQAYRSAIAEWMPFNFGATGLLPAFFISAVVVLAATAQRKYREFAYLRIAGFWVLALMSRIYMPYAVLSTAALLGNLQFKLGKDIMKYMAVGMVAFSCFLLGYKGIPHDLDQVAAASGYPVQAVEYLQEHHVDRVYNDHGWGGYLIWKGVPVSIDGRNDVYGKFFDDCLNVVKEDKPAGQVIQETGADAVLTARNGSIDAALKESPEWKLAYKDSAAVIYKKV